MSTSAFARGLRLRQESLSLGMVFSIPVRRCCLPSQQVGRFHLQPMMEVAEEDRIPKQGVQVFWQQQVPWRHGIQNNSSLPTSKSRGDVHHQIAAWRVLGAHNERLASQFDRLVVGKCNQFEDSGSRAQYRVPKFFITIYQAHRLQLWTRTKDENQFGLGAQNPEFANIYGALLG